MRRLALWSVVVTIALTVVTRDNITLSAAASDVRTPGPATPRAENVPRGERRSDLILPKTATEPKGTASVRDVGLEVPRRSRHPSPLPLRGAERSATADEAVVAQVAAPSQPVMRAEPVATGFAFPLFVTSPPDDPRLFVVEKGGRIFVLKDGVRLPVPFLDLSGQVSGGFEQGLLGLAFHPAYAMNGRFFVHYTDRAGDTHLVEYHRSADPDRADPEPVATWLAIDQPSEFHNGGMIVFGPDKHLYLALGDGGGVGDPQEHGQNPLTPLGNLLRLNVEALRFDPSAAVLMYGLRNPWRFSIDPVEGLIYIGDVGEHNWEEVNVVPYVAAGTNFGWDVMEGSHCFEPQSRCKRLGLTVPVLEYSHQGAAQGEDHSSHPHSGNCAVVYRGRSMPELHGHYFYADFCGGWVRSFRYINGEATDHRDWSSSIGDVGPLSSFGVDADGELYLTSTHGTVYRIVRAL